MTVLSFSTALFLVQLFSTVAMDLENGHQF